MRCEKQLCVNSQKAASRSCDDRDHARADLVLSAHGFAAHLYYQSGIQAAARAAVVSPDIYRAGANLAKLRRLAGHYRRVGRSSSAVLAEQRNRHAARYDWDGRNGLVMRLSALEAPVPRPAAAVRSRPAVALVRDGGRGDSEIRRCADAPAYEYLLGTCASDDRSAGRGLPAKAVHGSSAERGSGGGEDRRRNRAQNFHRNYAAARFASDGNDHDYRISIGMGQYGDVQLIHAGRFHEDAGVFCRDADAGVVELGCSPRGGSRGSARSVLAVASCFFALPTQIYRHNGAIGYQVSERRLPV